MEDQFKNVEKEFERLRDKFRQKEISDSDFKKRLRELRLQDKEGHFWTIGAQTGKWYYFDGNDWIEAKPPSLQEKKAICVYCGYENELENASCAYCGERFEKDEDEEEEKAADFTCPKCGRILDKYTFFCPDCDVAETPDEKVWETGEISEAENDEEPIAPQKLEFVMEEEEPIAERFEQVLRAIHPFSMLLFFGAIGLLLGIVLGAFAGATEFLMGGASVLPPFLEELQGSLIGGILFGIFGGLLGFIVLGLLGYLGALVFNVVFSFIGGIKIHIERSR